MSENLESPLNEEALERARSYREGLAWWRDELVRESSLETAQPGGAPSATPISAAAFDLIVLFEVSGQTTYERKYRHPVWPGGASGVTIAVGYDVGYATNVQLHADWDGAIDSDMVAALKRALKVTGQAAHALASQLAGVDVPWSAASAVHREKVLPRWVGIVERALLNTVAIGPDCLGALVSLTYNRGASFSKQGDRYAEMRAIKSDMQARDFASIPGRLRSMKRLWPDVAGLQIPREKEAKLFERGLAGIS
jgi:hypothetical protein